MSEYFFGYIRPDRRLTLCPFFPVTILPVECNLTSSFEEGQARVRYPASRAPVWGSSNRDVIVSSRSFRPGIERSCVLPDVLTSLENEMKYRKKGRYEHGIEQFCQVDQGIGQQHIPQTDYQGARGKCAGGHARFGRSGHSPGTSELRCYGVALPTKQ
jgi:hypothetical protein